MADMPHAVDKLVERWLFWMYWNDHKKEKGQKSSWMKQNKEWIEIGLDTMSTSG